MPWIPRRRQTLDRRGALVALGFAVMLLQGLGHATTSLKPAETDSARRVESEEARSSEPTPRSSLPSQWLKHHERGPADVAFRHEDSRARVLASRSLEPAATLDGIRLTPGRPPLVHRQAGNPSLWVRDPHPLLHVFLCVWLT